MEREENKLPEKVKVVVRCRPLNTKEVKQGHTNIINISESRNAIQIINPKKEGKATSKIFEFDSVYGIKSTQEQIYNESVSPYTESVLDGYNATIFAYGQTGAGKTYTMEGYNFEPYHKGIMARAFDQLFEYINYYNENIYAVRCSYLQLYQDEVLDLLDISTKKTCDIKGNGSNTYVTNLKSFPCTSSQQMYKLMVHGNQNRKTGKTNMNDYSSRSHAMFIITVQIASKQNNSHIKIGKLNLVDLAGSERLTKSQSTGELMKEAAKINLSLTALGKVISALANGKQTHIPYRDSKLTKILQDSLGGSGKTLMIANIGPCSDNFTESYSTLTYASQVKKIKNTPSIHEVFKNPEPVTDCEENSEQVKSPIEKVTYCCARCGVKCENCSTNSSRLSNRTNLVELHSILSIFICAHDPISPEATSVWSKIGKDLTKKIEQLHKEERSIRSRMDKFSKDSIDYDILLGFWFNKELEITALMRNVCKYMIDNNYWKCNKKHLELKDIYIIAINKDYNNYIMAAIPEHVQRGLLDKENTDVTTQTVKVEERAEKPVTDHHNRQSQTYNGLTPTRPGELHGNSEAKTKKEPLFGYLGDGVYFWRRN